MADEQYQPTQHLPLVTLGADGLGNEAGYCRECHRVWERRRTLPVLVGGAPCAHWAEACELNPGFARMCDEFLYG